MTTGRINQVTSPYKLNKQWVLLLKERRKTHLKKTLPASLLATSYRVFGMEV